MTPSGLTTLADWIAANGQLVAPIVAFIASWVLYVALGKHVLGADDDYWPALRHALLPILHRLGAGAGLYAAGQQTHEEFVATVGMAEEAFEEELEAAGFYRNPIASLKTSPDGRPSAGSWARRYNRVRKIGDSLRADAHERGVPLVWVIEALLGRFFQGVGDVMALRQIHVTIYTVESGQMAVFAHSEYNSLNPLTAWTHYTGVEYDAAHGVQEMIYLLREREIPYSVVKPPSSSLSPSHSHSHSESESESES